MADYPSVRLGRLAVISGGAADPDILSGTADPTAGLVAPEGSFYLRFVAGGSQMYQKTGAAATAWSAMATTEMVTANSAMLGWGNSNIAATADTRFLDTWYNQATAPTVAIAIPVPRAGTLRNLFVRHNVANGNGADVVYTIMVNGVATLMTVTIATNLVTQASDLVNTAVVAQGARVTLRAAKAASIGSGAQEVTASVELRG